MDVIVVDSAKGCPVNERRLGGMELRRDEVAARRDRVAMGWSWVDVMGWTVVHIDW